MGGVISLSKHSSLKCLALSKPPPWTTNLKNTECLLLQLLDKNMSLLTRIKVFFSTTDCCLEYPPLLYSSATWNPTSRSEGRLGIH